MAKRIGKYKITKRESAMTLADGGTVDGNLYVAGSCKSLVAVKTGDVGTLAAGDSGALVSLSGGARTVILPAVAKTGVNFRIVAGSAHNHIISCSVGEEDKLQGGKITAKSGMTLVNGAIGDSIFVVSDGTSWHLSALVTNTPTFT